MIFHAVVGTRGRRSTEAGWILTRAEAPHGVPLGLPLELVVDLRHEPRPVGPMLRLLDDRVRRHDDVSDEAERQIQQAQS